MTCGGRERSTTGTGAYTSPVWDAGRATGPFGRHGSVTGRFTTGTNRPRVFLLLPFMHQQSSRQLQERLTSLDIPSVLAEAARFFARGGGIYTAFVEKRGPTHVVMRGQGGEELVVAARTTEAGTMVSGSSYLFDQQVARFLDALPPAAPLAPAPVQGELAAGEAIPS